MTDGGGAAGSQALLVVRHAAGSDSRRACLLVVADRGRRSGMTITTWLESRGVVDHADGERFWEDLSFPDLLYVDPAARSWERPHII